MGGFCAYGNPGSFHNKFARSLRYLAHRKILPVLMSLIALYYPALTKKEQLIDRMQRRPKQVCCTADNQWQWHISGKPLEPMDTDQIFGGWVNLDNEDQYFRCVPESHYKPAYAPPDGGRGFATLSQDAVNQLSGNNQQQDIRITGGSIRIFYQNIIHCVRPVHRVPNNLQHSRASHEVRSRDETDRLTFSFRLFTAFRITTSNKPLTISQDNLQGFMTPYIPSGQLPPVYSKMHASSLLSCPKNSPIIWRENMLVHYKTEMGIETTKKDQEDFWDSRNKLLNVPPRFLTCNSHPSWHFNDAWYPSYDNEERMIYQPASIQTLRNWMQVNRPSNHLDVPESKSAHGTSNILTMDDSDSDSADSDGRPLATSKHHTHSMAKPKVVIIVSDSDSEF